MAESSAPRRNSGKAAVETLLAVALFCGGLWWCLPDAPHVLIDQDEGLNIGKAFMLTEGFPLYEQVWSDQPPLYTYLLSGWMGCFGQTLGAARGLSVLFSGILLGSLYGLVRSRESSGAGLLVCGLLLVSSDFLRASGAVMIGLPALAFFYLSLLLISVENPPRGATVASGVCLGCALMTKLFVTLYSPVYIAVLLFSKEQRVRRVVLWAGAILGTLALLTILPGSSFWANFQEQLWAPHVAAQTALPTGKGLNLLRFDMSIGLISLLSLVYFSRLRVPIFLYVLGLSALAFHRPSWWHHYFVASIPMCWIAGVGISASASVAGAWVRHRKFRWRILPSAMILCLAAYVLVSLPIRIQKLSATYQKRAFRFPVAVWLRMERLKSSTKWIATDQPIAAVLVDRPMPPGQVVLSTKRFKAGLYSPSEFFDTALKYDPEQFLLARHEVLREMGPARLGQSYELVFETPKLQLYQRRDLVKKK